ncbi:MAG: hypothetical protein JWN48_5201 [Myxococcaceae bacterium]|nr:hypothetical protein [Myxococcaceae bacterium]
MSPPEPSRAPIETTALGTLGWVAVVLVGAVLAVLLLSWLGPVGGQ